MTFQEYRQYDALGLAELIRKKEITPIELLEIAIQRAEAVNPQINAIVHKLYDYGKAMLQNIPSDSPFAGVPFLIKDLGISVKDTPMNTGCRALKDFITPQDSILAQRLRKAGFVFLGKTNTSEFGLTPYVEPLLHGKTSNPWNLGHSSGGSSGGSSAAVAAGITPIATASDGGGSIRIPASCAGLFGLKPSRGTISLAPYSEKWSGFVVENCVSRSVRDSAAYYDAIKGGSPGELYNTTISNRPLMESLTIDAKPLRIGFATSHPLNGTTHKECILAVEHTAKLLENLGHQVETVELPFYRVDILKGFIPIVAAETTAALAEVSGVLGRKLKVKDVEPNTWALNVLGRKLSAADYAHARQIMGKIARRMGAFHQKYDVLLTPVLSKPPIAHGEMQNSKFEQFLVNIVNRFDLGGLLKANVEDFADKAFGYIPYPALANMTGQPSMSVPLYWSADGLPIGSMFTARMGEDDLLYRLAGQLERAQPWFGKVAPL